MQTRCDSERAATEPQVDGRVKTPCHTGAVPMHVGWTAGVVVAALDAALWADVGRAAVVVVLVVVVVIGLRAVDRRDRGEIEDSDE